MSLKYLVIKHCWHMKTLITGEKELHENSTLFPSLKLLVIKDLPNLEMLCEWRFGLEWPLLHDVSIDGCLQMKFLTLGSLSTPNLYHMSIEDQKFKEKEGMKDLNRFFHQHIMGTREMWKFRDISYSSQLKTLKLPDPLTPRKVAQLLYGSSGQEILALASNAIYKRWKWETNDRNPSGKSYAATVPIDDLNDANDPTEDSLACIAIAMDRDRYVMPTSDGKLSVFDMNSRIIITLMLLPPATTCLAFNPLDYDVIAIGMEDSTIHIYNWEVGEIIAQLMGGHQKRISGLTFSKVLDILVSSGADAQLCVWRVNGWEKEKSRPIQGPPGHPAPLAGETRVQFHNSQHHLLVVHESQIAIYDAQLDCLRSWYSRDSLSSPISSAVYSCDGRMVFAGFCDGAVGIFDFDSLTIRCRIAPHAYLSSPIPSKDYAFPVVITAHPSYPNQFALGMNDGEVYVIEPSDKKTQSEASTSVENTMLPSMPSNDAINSQPSEN